MGQDGIKWDGMKDEGKVNERKRSRSASVLLEKNKKRRVKDEGKTKVKEAGEKRSQGKL